MSRRTISIIVGSTRPVRIGRDLADAIASRIGQEVEADVRILDLAEIALPLLDEPLKPSMNSYRHAHTIAWAQAVADSDAVIFLTPQYNGGYPAGLKNAIDYLYAEWQGRPAAIISYGGRGGTAAARQLSEVLAFVGVDLIGRYAALAIGRADYAPDWTLADADAVIDRHADEVLQVARDLQRRLDAADLARAA